MFIRNGGELKVSLLDNAPNQIVGFIIQKRTAVILSNDLTQPHHYLPKWKAIMERGIKWHPPLWVIDGGKWETNFHFLLLAFFIFWVSFYPQWILYAFQNACLSSCSSLILASIPFGIDEKRANIVVLLVSSSSQPGLLYEYSTYIRWYTFYIFLDKFKHS